MSIRTQQIPEQLLSLCRNPVSRFRPRVTGALQRRFITPYGVAVVGGSAARMQPRGAATQSDTQQQGQRSRVLLVTGPTGVGKTETSLLLAEHLGGEIISADSVQVYRGLDIGSDKLPVSERRGAHFLPALSCGWRTVHMPSQSAYSPFNSLKTVQRSNTLFE